MFDSLKVIIFYHQFFVKATWTIISQKTKQMRTPQKWLILASFIMVNFLPDLITNKGNNKITELRTICSEISVHINIYEITWIVPLCYYNGHIRNPLPSVLFLIKVWHKRYLFVKNELINTCRLLSLDYHLFGINI